MLSFVSRFTISSLKFQVRSQFNHIKTCCNSHYKWQNILTKSVSGKQLKCINFFIQNVSSLLFVTYCIVLHCIVNMMNMNIVSIVPIKIYIKLLNCLPLCQAAFIFPSLFKDETMILQLKCIKFQPLKSIYEL